MRSERRRGGFWLFKGEWTMGWRERGDEDGCLKVVGKKKKVCENLRVRE